MLHHEYLQRCGKCLREISEKERYEHQSENLCEDCYMDARATRSRKTHWQYIRSVKAEYLRPARQKKEADR